MTAFVSFRFCILLAANFRSSKKQPLYACPYMNDCENRIINRDSVYLALFNSCLSLFISPLYRVYAPFLSLMMFHLFMLLFSVPSASIPALSHFSFSSSFRLGRSTMAYYTTLLLLNTRFYFFFVHVHTYSFLRRF
ncbi:hypothetical protein I7I50_02492 [Histoplasma capsulatum G186AR]|uniref:Uncharacterized protein n=1 Tax=Ajellomyces capsulatus TaxID=5037 RepID=A0A8H7Z585_AJECA|nr:hypothetical protein I7I52_00844 [Histoplasma capsulatum]QSS71594.1 hypothetical protein I7I50_02492 [Histoplasma capsulatum G186AR]